MQARMAFFAWFGCVFLSPLFAQSPNEVVGAGNGPPGPVAIAPGQAITLFVRGLKDREAMATSVPLPTVLAGVSVQAEGKFADVVANASRGLVWKSLPPMPIFGLHRLCRAEGVDPYACTLCRRDKGKEACEQVCRSGLCDVSAITVQFPFDLISCSDSPLDACFAHFPVPLRVTVIEDGVPGATFEGQTVVPNLHIVHSCDSLVRLFSADSSSECIPMIRRPDGSLVSGRNPAKAGEIVSVYLVGLGIDERSGSLAGVFVNFDFRPFVTPTPLDPPLFQATTALWAGPAPGFAGLYQVNVKFPDPLPLRVPPCGTSGTMRLTLLTSLFSSLPVSSLGNNSTASANVCVQP